MNTVNRVLNWIQRYHELITLIGLIVTILFGRLRMTNMTLVGVATLAIGLYFTFKSHQTPADRAFRRERWHAIFIFLSMGTIVCGVLYLIGLLAGIPRSDLNVIVGFIGCMFLIVIFIMNQMIKNNQIQTGGE